MTKTKEQGKAIKRSTARAATIFKPQWFVAANRESRRFGPVGCAVQSADALARWLPCNHGRPKCSIRAWKITKVILFKSIIRPLARWPPSNSDSVGGPKRINEAALKFGTVAVSLWGVESILSYPKECRCRDTRQRTLGAGNTETYTAFGRAWRCRGIWWGFAAVPPESK